MEIQKAVQFRPANRLMRQQGASLLEGIAYLGIAAIVVLGAVSLLTGAFGSAKSNQTAEELIALRTGVRKLYAGQAYTNGDLRANLIRANAVPSTLVINRVANTVTNSWSGAVTITGNGAGVFTITYGNVPQDVCIGIVSGANGWQTIAQGTNTINTFPATAVDAGTLCANTTNDVVFTAT